MRHNDARKWLHAALDLLPVLLIPVFMIYSHRHDVGITETRQEPTYYQSNDVENYTDLVIGNVYTWNDSWTGEQTSNPVYYFGIYNNDVIRQFFEIPTEATNIRCYKRTSGTLRLIYNYNGTEPAIDVPSNKTFNFVLYNVITQQDFISHVEKCDVKYLSGYIDVEVENTIMESFMDSFNYSIDKYFNMGNVFNLTGVYEWFNTNIFGGNAPTIIYSVWNIALYELVMDLLFLLYGLFMWFIDMCKHLMEKPFRSIN